MHDIKGTLTIYLNEVHKKILKAVITFFMHNNNKEIQAPIGKKNAKKISKWAVTVSLCFVPSRHQQNNCYPPPPPKLFTSTFRSYTLLITNLKSCLIDCRH